MSEMKKIGILTYFWTNNPGTFLQAYSTLEALRKRFPNDRVELIDYRRRKVHFRPNRRSIWLGQLVKDIRRHAIYRSMVLKEVVIGQLHD